VYGWLMGEGGEGMLYHTTSVSTDGGSFVYLYCWSRFREPEAAETVVEEGGE
jgi:hypothetical protein